MDKFTENINELLKDCIIYDSTAAEEEEQTDADDEDDTLNVAKNVATDPKNPAAGAAKSGAQALTNTYTTLMKGVTTKLQKITPKA